jgi:hypothetical protein
VNLPEILTVFQDAAESDSTDPTLRRALQASLKYLTPKARKPIQQKPSSPEDIDWSRQVKERDGYICQRCGHGIARGRVEAHHAFKRGKAGTRLDVDNGITLCAGPMTNDCHGWAENNPQDFAAWFRGRIGSVKFEALWEKSEQSTKIVPRRGVA